MEKIELDQVSGASMIRSRSRSRCSYKVFTVNTDWKIPTKVGLKYNLLISLSQFRLKHTCSALLADSEPFQHPT